MAKGRRSKPQTHARKLDVSMNRVLRVPEVQILVFENLRETGQLSSLANVASTCQDLKEKALDALWLSQTKLSLLIQVMPSDLWKHDKQKSMIIFNRALEESDWLRFDYYSRRMRKLELDDLSYLDIFGPNFDEKVLLDESVFKELSAYRPTRDLFPNLTEIQIEILDLNMAASISYLPAFLGPKVTHINITALFDFRSLSDTLPVSNNLPAFLSSVGRLCPRIRKFQLNTDEALLAPLKKLLKGLRHLRALTLECPMDPEILRQLVNLPDLRYLSLCAVRPSRKFKFNMSLETAAGLLSRLKVPFEHLTIKINLPTIMRTSSLTAMMQALVHHTCVSSLTHLQLFDGDGPYDLEKQHYKDPDAIRATMTLIFALKALRVLSIQYYFASYLDDEWIASASKAWPFLENLHLGKNRSAPTATLAGLIPLIRRCPRLKQIAISIHVTPFDTALLHPGDRNMNITSLHLLSSTLSNPPRAFRCLVILFPNLTKVDAVGLTKKEQDWVYLQKLLE
ncbi:hypothetical protein H0H81_010438 [Sphagnurus paluster]|uniref:F-box domain-containing protein n=1 Tax=Sphagnurus paluster TaxID=117069 RepID=A0A9P7GJ41_9AGAR|nr:hypothetical protein H0H81_010438 [Sphagnurus paluster]